MSFKTFLEKWREEPTAYIWDVDDTLVTTDAKIIVRDDKTGDVVTKLTPQEYNTFKLKNGQELDFTEFSSGDILTNTGKKTKYWKVAQKISDAISRGDSNSVLYILTARPYTLKKELYEYLFRNGLKALKQINVYAVGDTEDGKTIAQLKQDALKKIEKDHGETWFFDDDTKNIELAKALDTIKTREVKI
jgi:FMN phosphatase YigB (HAD superfamily)